jgi:antirestriction protein ArdC
MSVTVYEIITSQIIAQLEKGVAPWRQPRIGGLPKNLVSRKSYRGINLFLLSMSECEYFVTRKQAEELGGTIRCKGLPIVFWKMLERENQKSGETEAIPFMRYYKVYPVNGVEGLELPSTGGENNSPIERAEAIIRKMPNRPTINYGGNRACFIPSRDEVRVPALHSFPECVEFYQTTFHELAHSTGHVSRLNREGITRNWKFGSDEYSNEELLAEMTASFLSGVAGIEQKIITSSAAYLQGWLKKMKADPKLIIQVSSRAQKAADYILHYQNDDPG